MVWHNADIWIYRATILSDTSFTISVIHFRDSVSIYASSSQWKFKTIVSSLFREQPTSYVHANINSNV